MLEFARNWPTIDIAEQMLVVFSLVWEPSVIDKNILSLLVSLGFVHNANRQTSHVVWRGGNRWDIEVAIGMIFWCACLRQIMETRN
jgi:hypothetical protein